MEVNLKKLLPNKAKRIGRGIGSGKGGHTVGYGQKGQGSRGSHKVKSTMEGGNIPTYRKLPTLKGFKSLQKSASTVTIAWLNAHSKEGSIVDRAFLVAASVLRKVTDKAKIVGKDKVSHKITLKGVLYTAGAKMAIEKAGGNVVD